MTASAVTSSPTGPPTARNNIPNSNNSRLAFVDLTSAGRHLTSVLGIGPALSSPLSAISFTGTNGTARRQFVDSTVPDVASNATAARTPTIPATSSSTPSPRSSAELSTATTTTIPLHSSKTTTTIITNSKRPTIIIYPTVSPESIVIPIVSCILGFPLLALLVICCLRRRAKLARERDRRRNYDMQDHAVSLVRFSPIHRLNNRSSRAISLRPERSLSRGFPSLELDTVIEERSDPEQTQIDILSPDSPLDPQKYRDFNSS